MPVKEPDTPFPIIDVDPHFKRVVSYMRPSDYAAWGTATLAFPSTIYFMEMFDSTRPRRGLAPALRLATFLGAAGGFLFAYQRSSFRLWGWRENEIEQSRAATEDKPLGTDVSNSDLEPYIRGVAHRNSAYSQLKFSTMPWFNVVNHEHHGSAAAEQQAKEE